LRVGVNEFYMKLYILQRMDISTDTDLMIKVASLA